MSIHPRSWTREKHFYGFSTNGHRFLLILIREFNTFCFRIVCFSTLVHNTKGFSMLDCIIDNDNNEDFSPQTSFFFESIRYFIFQGNLEYPVMSPLHKQGSILRNSLSKLHSNRQTWWWCWFRSIRKNTQRNPLQEHKNSMFKWKSINFSFTRLICFCKSHSIIIETTEKFIGKQVLFVGLLCAQFVLRFVFIFYFVFFSNIIQLFMSRTQCLV